MRIIPVLDLLEGLVVHAVKGQRERYQPVRSILAASADPLEVAGCLQAETKCRTFYIADLNAIQGKGHNREAIGKIASQLDVELWVDAGVADGGSANRLVEAGADVVIIGSETLSGLQQLRFICDSVPREVRRKAGTSDFRRREPAWWNCDRPLCSDSRLVAWSRSRQRGRCSCGGP